MAGLPFEQLPATSPEQSIQQELQSSLQRVQERFTLQWDTVNSNARTLGPNRHKAMLTQLKADAEQEVLGLRQQAEQQSEQLRRVDNISAAGGFTSGTANELKATMVYGRDIAGAIYPDEKKERTIPQQFSELDTYGDRISQELEFFKAPSKPSTLTTGLRALSPLAHIALAARKKNYLRVYNPNTGEYDRAKPEDAIRYSTLLNEEKAIKQRKTELLGHPSITRRKVQPGTAGGTFGDKIAASYKKPDKRQTEAELRKLGTREAYDKGVTLGYWQ